MIKRIASVVILAILVMACSRTEVIGDDNNNVSGDNTLISGGYTSSSTTNFQSGSESTTTSTTTNTTNSKSYPNVSTASAPPTSSGIDVCHLGSSLGLQSSVFGFSSSSSAIDENCVRIKLARELATVHQMKVAGIAILCQDPIVFRAMMSAGTPCPFEGKIGKEAMAQWNKYEVERPDYETYVKKLETRSRIDDELEAIRLQKEQEELSRKIAEEKLKLATLKEQEEVDNIIIETDLETQKKVIINVHE